MTTGIGSLNQMNAVVVLKTVVVTLIITGSTTTVRIGQEISVNTNETALVSTVDALSTSIQKRDVIAVKIKAATPTKTAMTNEFDLPREITARTVEANAPVTTLKPMTASIVISMKSGVMTALMYDLELKSFHHDRLLRPPPDHLAIVYFSLRNLNWRIMTWSPTSTWNL